MELLGTISQPADLEIGGKFSLRRAVRAIVHRQRALLMVYSPKNGDYKFPGGGIEPGETHPQALSREIAEECGSRLTAVLGPYGKMVSYKAADDGDFDLFKMESYYYRCTVAPGFGRQTLDAYEEELQFTPVWVDIDRAILTNRAVLEAPSAKPPPWTRRDTFVLEHCKKNLGI